MNNLNGLTSKQAKNKLQKFGKNQIKSKKQVRPLKVFLSQFTSPLIYILVLAAVVTAVLGEWGDTLVIGLAVALNAFLGFYQEYRAEKSMEALKAALSPQARVKRDGNWRLEDAKNIVPGDLVRLEMGMKVAADGLIVEASSLSINEAILTGESEPVGKTEIQDLGSGTQDLSSKHKAFMGTTVVSGIGVMKVEKTGMQTKMGEIAKNIDETQAEPTPLQKQVSRLSRTLAILVAGVSGLLFVGGVLEGGSLLEMFETSVAVAVAAIPEGLAISLTAILALGMQRILKKKAVVRKLVAAETLGATTVICCDKTGTLTEGKMRVVKAVYDLKSKFRKKSKRAKEFFKTAVLCNDVKDPLEIGILDWAKALKVKIKQLEDKHKRLDEIPFDSEKKFKATLHQGKNKNLILVTGAPEVVLEMSQISKKAQENWEKKLEKLGKKGLRLIALARKETKAKKLKSSDLKNLEWQGLIVFEDPVRLGVSQALSEAKKAGIEVKVITGDYKETAMAVVEKLGINGEKLEANQVITGKELRGLSDQELRGRIDDLVLFARTDPVQKLRIVKALQAQGEVVAMTGDGVNDAPALKRADIGIVVKSASDVSKEVADMVLLDSNFKTILAAVKEGRKIWENIKKIVTYLLSDSFTELVLIAGAIFFKLPLPILATQILWVNLVEDGLPGMALVFEEASDKVMQESPRDQNEPILDSEMKALIFIIGIVTDLFLFGLFYLMWRQGQDIDLIRTFIFAGVGIDSLLYVFSCKSLKQNIWQVDIFKNRFLIFSVLVGFSLLLAGVYVPFLQKLLTTQALPFLSLGFLLILGFLKMVLIEGTKYFYIKSRK